MARIPDAPGFHGGTPFYRLMAHNPMMFKKYLIMRNSYWEDGVLSPSLKELVRLLVSDINHCEFCLGVRTSWAKEDGVDETKLAKVREFDEHRGDFTERELVALEYAQSFCLNLGRVSDDVFERAKAVFTPAEIAELTFCLAMFAAGNWIMNALGIEYAGEQSGFYGGSGSSEAMRELDRMIAVRLGAAA